MAVESGSLNGGHFDDNSILLVVTNSEYNEYFFLFGHEIVRFFTEDKLINFIPNIGNNMVVYAIAVGKKYLYFLSDLYKFVENGKSEEGALLNIIANSLDLFDYHVLKCDENAFTEINYEELHTFYTDDDHKHEDQGKDPLIMEYNNGKQ